MVTVHIPAVLRTMTLGDTLVRMEAANVREVVEQLEVRYPGIRQRLCDGDRLKPGLAVAIDSRIHSRGLLEPLSPGCEVHFLPAVSGGV